MASKREQILAALKTQLATLTGVSVYRSRLTAATREEGLVIVLSWDTDTVEKRSNALLDWQLSLRVAVIARGAVPDSVADSTAVAAHAKVMEDENLGGLCLGIEPLVQELEMAEADQDAGMITLRYLIRYRTHRKTLDS